MAFTPELAATYQKMKEDGNDDGFEIIFVSLDRDDQLKTHADHTR